MTFDEALAKSGKTYAAVARMTGIPVVSVRRYARGRKPRWRRRLSMMAAAVDQKASNIEWGHTLQLDLEDYIRELGR